MSADLRPLVGAVALALRGTPFAPPRRWPLAVVVLRSDEPPKVKLRADLAGFFAANALPQLARACTKRKVPPGSILVWLEADTPEIAAAGFYVFDLVSALRSYA